MTLKTFTTLIEGLKSYRDKKDKELENVVIKTQSGNIIASDQNESI